MMEALEAASFGFEILLATKSHQRILIGQGLEGVRRVVTERRTRKARAWLHAAKRAKLIDVRRIGDRLKVVLAEKGRIRLLESRITSAPHLGGGERTYVTFDFPVSQRRSRDAFRRFLKTAGFRMIQQSLWSTKREAAKPLLALIARSGTEDWVRILRGIEETV